MKWRPAAGLLVLSPLVGEYLLGDVPIKDLPALPYLVPMYGCGALLVREVARRIGAGWPTILLLGAAYGLIEPALFDGSLFNPRYEGLDFSDGYLPALGFSPNHALSFVVGHAVWSITIPIALVEIFVRDRRTAPWLGPIGLTVTAVGYVAGGLLIRQSEREEFRNSLAQSVAAALVALLIVGAAFAVRRMRPRTTGVRLAPSPLLIGGGTFLLSSAYFVGAEGWAGVVLSLAILAVGAVAISRLARMPGWDDRHGLALAGGTLLTYAWGALVVGSFTGYDDALSRAGNLIFALAAVALLVLAARHVRRDRKNCRTPEAQSNA